MLGEYIASERQGKSQLFVATHSTDIVEGLLAGNQKNARIVRIQRDHDINRINELSKTRISAIVSDTLTKYSRVLEGLFYRHVIIAESDSDCMFYSAMLSSEAISGQARPDVLFLHASRKHRMANLAQTLRDLGVPTTVIADIDILNEEDTISTLVESLGGQWIDLKAHWQAIKTSVEEGRPSLNADQVKTRIAGVMDNIAGPGVFPKTADKQIRAILRSTSAWESIKHNGRTGFTGAQTIKHFDQLSAECKKIGVFLVPVGELEGFCRTIEAKKGPAFVEKLLEEKNLNTDPDLKEARDFMDEISSRMKELN